MACMQAEHTNKRKKKLMSHEESMSMGQPDQDPMSMGQPDDDPM